MEQEVLDALNKLIREEKGNRVTIDSKWVDADVDSFGTVMVITQLSQKYPKLKGLPDSDVFNDLDFLNLTIKELVIKCI